MPAFNSGRVGNTGTCSHFILCTCFSYILLVLYSETYYSVFCSTLAHLLIELIYSILNLNSPFFQYLKKNIRQKFLNFKTFRKKDEFHLLHDKIRQMVKFFLLGAKTYPNGLPFFNYKEKTISRIFPSFRCMIFSTEYFSQNITFFVLSTLCSQHTKMS